MKNTVETSTQFISYNKPGIAGYSQRGSIGDQGSDGSQIYFTPYVGNDAACIEKIKNGKELSNNTNYTSSNIVYHTNDLVFDINGDLWKMTIVYSLVAGEEETITDVYMTKQNNLLSYDSSVNSDTFITAFNVNRDTDSSSNTPHSFRQVKTDFEFDASNNSLPYQFYRDRLTKYTYGNWYKMHVEFKNSVIDDNYVYKFVIVLPSGITVEKMSNSSADWIFIDNRVLYGEHHITDPSIFSTLKTSINYVSGSNNNENTYSVATAFSTEIAALCKAYVEIMDKTSGMVYRVYSNISNSAPND